MSDTPQYLSLKCAQAAKTGQGSSGLITYRILTDADRDALYLTLVANEGGGWFSNEIVPVAHIEDVFARLADRHQPLATKLLRPAFVSRSVNNAGFLAAVLRAEGLLTAAPDAPHLHVLTDDWDLWKEMMLAEPVEPYVPPPKAAGAKGETMAKVIGGTQKPAINNANDETGPELRGRRKTRKNARADRQNRRDAETLAAPVDTIPGDSRSHDEHPDADSVPEADNADAA